MFSYSSCKVVFLAQATAIARIRDPAKRYRFAFVGALEQAVLFSILLLLHKIWNVSHQKRCLLLANLTCLAVNFLVCLAFPRRPGVYHRGNIVDGQRTVSAINHVTFSWVTSLLALIVSQGTLDVDDLPALDHSTRAQELHDSFNETNRKGKLATLLIMAHGRAIMWQHHHDDSCRPRIHASGILIQTLAGS
jgi:hypothetical protein